MAFLPLRVASDLDAVAATIEHTQPTWVFAQAGREAVPAITKTNTCTLWISSDPQRDRSPSGQVLSVLPVARSRLGASAVVASLARVSGVPFATGELTWGVL